VEPACSMSVCCQLAWSVFPPFLRRPLPADRPILSAAAQLPQEATFKVAIGVKCLRANDSPRYSRAPAWPANRRVDVFHRSVRVLEYLVLPQLADTPAAFLEFPRLPFIPRHVLSKLLGGEVGAASRPDVVVGTAVPETSVDEDGDPRTGEDDVGSAEWRFVMDAIAKPLGPEKLAQQDLGLRILRANARHLLGPGPGHPAILVLRAPGFTLEGESRDPSTKPCSWHRTSRQTPIELSDLGLPVISASPHPTKQMHRAVLLGSSIVTRSASTPVRRSTSSMAINPGPGRVER